jgi:hypothetical protein
MSGETSAVKDDVTRDGETMRSDMIFTVIAGAGSLGFLYVLWDGRLPQNIFGRWSLLRRSEHPVQFWFYICLGIVILGFAWAILLRRANLI